MTAVLNIIYKLSVATNIIINLGLMEGIKTIINIFVFALSRGIPHLNKLK